MASSNESGNVSAMSTNEQASSSTRMAPRKLASLLAADPAGPGDRDCEWPPVDPARPTMIV